MRWHRAWRASATAAALLVLAACGGTVGEAQVGGAGQHNQLGGFNTVIAGGSHNRTTNSHSTVGGGSANAALGIRSTVAGGGSNLAERLDATVGGGSGNRAEGFAATVAGGTRNRAASYAVVAGGLQNAASGGYSAVLGGVNNEALGFASVVAGGAGNHAAGRYALVSGGLDGWALGDYAAVLGGRGSIAAADYSLASGRGAVVSAEHPGARLFADSWAAEFASAAADEFAVRATGGVRLVTAVAAAGEPTAGVLLPPGSGSWSSLSSRAAKSNLAPADGRRILQLLDRLPLYRWSYASQDPQVRHVGPMAEDFYAAFGLGDDPRYISTVDAQGVALAAVQAVHAKLRAGEQRLQSLERRNRQLEERMAELERAIPGGSRRPAAAPDWPWPALTGLGVGLAIGGKSRRPRGARPH